MSKKNNNDNRSPNNNKGQRTMSLLRSNSSISQNLAMTAKGATLASIYQAKKSGNEDTKVEVLKQQFQSRLEQKITKEPQQITTATKLLNSSHIPSRHEREVSEFRKLEREKSFDEARTAVQSQIEKIFMKTAAAAAANGTTNTTANNAKGKNATAAAVTAAAKVAAVATNNVRLSRRDQEQATSTPGKTTKKHLATASSTKSQVTSPVATTQLNYNNNTMTRRRMTSMEPQKVR